MQDISRDDINLLNGAETSCEKEMCSSVLRPSVVTPLLLKIPSTQSVTDISSANPIKLEDDTTDSYPSWHHISDQPIEMGSSKLLLQGSDDPLISRGANAVDDDQPSEFTAIIDSVGINRSCDNPKSQLKAKLQNSTKKSITPKPKKKGTTKLRFHHQALPAEYLSHYEATQGQHIPKATQMHRDETSKLTGEKSTVKNSHENVRNWLQKIAEIQNQSSPVKESKDYSDSEEVTNFDIQNSDENANFQKTPKRTINYLDLPYMGEMTLDNSKPRRGRKPKKADICHLIYKNYGTILPGTPVSAIDSKTLESNPSNLLKPEEPLNLCLRDHADSYSMSSNDEDVSETQTNSNCPTPVASPLDAFTDSILAANLKLSLPSVTAAEASSSEQTKHRPNWTDKAINSNLLLHPLNIYYQKLIESGSFSTANIETINHNNQLALKIPIPTNLLSLAKTERPTSTPEYPEQLPTPSSVKSENSMTTTTSHTTHQLPQKRKRSAIFIPPMPAENTSNPATEVSICKFKFTGGANPSLQEKKMLSVDSDGNYRYYSGTGDKSMRSYEFFPRESLQQSGAIPGMNCAGVFLNATGEKVTIDIPPPSAGLSNELLQIPDSLTNNVPPPSVSRSPSTTSASSPFPSPIRLRNSDTTNTRIHHQLHHHHHHHSSKKKKSRRAVQREKLEKTFKEKGFLIQTQQLESAEGATYCKFRQLKKFTRYLFRNWKDYLPPGEIQHANAAAVAAAAAAAALNNHRQLTTPPPPPPTSVIGSILAESYTNHQRNKDAKEIPENQSS